MNVRAEKLRDAVIGMAVRYAESREAYAYAAADGAHPDERHRHMHAMRRRLTALQRITRALANLAEGGDPR